MNETLRIAATTVGARISQTVCDTCTVTTAINAGPMPSASDGKNRSPYALIDSATSCPTVRRSGGSAAGRGWPGAGYDSLATAAGY